MEQIIALGTAPVDAAGFVEENLARFFPQQLERATGGFRETFERDVTPGIVNYLTAAGQGRSGAAGEAIAGAGRQALVPLTQGALSSAERIAGGLPLPGQVELSRLPQALQAAGAPRVAQLEEESQLRDLLLSFLFGQPFRSGVAGVGQVTKGLDPLTEALLGAAGSGAVAFGTAPAGSRLGPPLPPVA